MSDTKYQILKGFRDYLPNEQIARRKMIAKISTAFERFGFAPIATPALEPFELFAGKLGEDEKLIYKFTDLGGRQVALRYEFTASLPRFISDHPDLPKPFKRYQIDPVWRAENPQKGRFREFTQCDVDIIGADSLVADAEVIAAVNAALKSLDIGSIKVKYNNRKLIGETLAIAGISADKQAGFMRAVDKIDKIGEKKVSALLSDLGMPKNALAKYSETITEISGGFRKEFEKLLLDLEVEDVEFDPYLMRGLDYYTGPIFEISLSGKPEFGSIAGGGRYDQLVGKITGKDMPAVGCSIGLDRLFAALQELELIAPQSAAEVIVLNLDEDLVSDYLKMASILRDAELDTEFYFEPSKLDKQFKYAEAKNMKVAVIFGKDEKVQGKVNLKNLDTKKQVTVDLDDLVTQVKSMLW